MCESLSYREFKRLLDQFFQQPENEIVEAKVKTQLSRLPGDSYNQLLLRYFLLEGRINQYQLEKRLFPLAHELYTGLIIFINRIYSFELASLDFESLDGEEVGFLKFTYVKRFCRAMLVKALEDEKIPLTGKKRIQQALNKMPLLDKAIKTNKLEQKLPFDSSEVMSKLKHYLHDADIVADSPNFISCYFSNQDLKPIEAHLDMRKINAFSRKYLEKLFDEDKKKQINRVLQRLIFEQPEINQAKKAYVVYITLNYWENSWIDHPFIRRFILNSYFENKVAKLETRG